MAPDIFISSPPVAIGAERCPARRRVGICFSKSSNRFVAVTVSWWLVMWLCLSTFHLLFSEPERDNPSVVMKVLKQSFAHRLLARLRASAATRSPSLAGTELTAGHVWQRRFYDFVVFTEEKRVEKLRYMHRNPVVRGLVLKPEQWGWSSYRHYASGEPGPVLVNQELKAELRVGWIGG